MKHYVLIAIAVFLAAIGVWQLWKSTEDAYETEAQKSPTIKAIQRDWAKAVYENAQYKRAYAEMQDSLMSLTVEKGQVEIELNRKTEELKQANSRYKVSRVSKDTARALIICDSIVYQYVPDYLISDSTIGALSDSASAITDGWVRRQNVVIGSLFDKQDSVYIERIADKKEEKKQRRKHRLELLKVGGFGAAVGVLLTLILGG